VRARLEWCLAFWCGAPLAAGVAGVPQPPPSSQAAPPVPEVAIQAPEARYVAPTLRDQIGRIWAPVFINGKGPFRLVLDTGASSSAVTASVAQALGIPLNESASFELRGVNGSAVVPSIHVESLLIGDLLINSATLPIVPDALGGAQGVLGTEGLLDKRIFIDFEHDHISITRSHGTRAQWGFVTVPLTILANHLLTTTARVGSMPVTAIIDTGAESSIANLVLRQDLQRHRSRYKFADDTVLGATDVSTKGQDAAFPPIYLGKVQILGAHITTGDLQIFDVFNLTDKPAILIGMDALGTLDELVIDYRRRELQVLVRSSGISEDRQY
jgi:predicted aspartyl protease